MAVDEQQRRCDEEESGEGSMSDVMTATSEEYDDTSFMSESSTRSIDFRGERYAAGLRAHPIRFRRQFGLTTRQFDALLARISLQQEYYISCSQKLAIFLRLATTGDRIPLVQEDFGHDLETIVDVVDEVAKSLIRIHHAILKPARQTDCEILAKRKDSDKYWPFFKDALGALGGFHLPVTVSDGRWIAWRNRKGQLTTNVLGVVDFSGKFTFVLSGWEGSAGDRQVLRSAMSPWRNKNPLKTPTKETYWLAGPRYRNSASLLLPYLGVRSRPGEQGPRNARELFNLRHASLRRVQERAFALFQKRFRVFHVDPLRSIQAQNRIFYACAAIHNFLIEYAESSRGEEDEENDEEMSNFQDDDGSMKDDTAHLLPKRERHEDGIEMARRRDQIAEAMWAQYLADRRGEV